MVDQSYESALRETDIDIDKLTKSHNPRIRLFTELTRALNHNGLLIFQGIQAEDMAVASRVGMIVAEYDPEAENAILIKA